jgi:hypothetical protein
VNTRPFYRGIEYAIRARGKNRWEWAFYIPTGSGAPVGKGDVSGARSKAVDACLRAIDVHLAIDSQPDDES